MQERGPLQDGRSDTVRRSAWPDGHPPLPLLKKGAYNKSVWIKVQVKVQNGHLRISAAAPRFARTRGTADPMT